MNLREKTMLVADHGLNLHIVRKMAETYKKVYLYVPELDAFPGLTHDIIGDIPGVERVYDFFKATGKADIISFFDTGFSDWQWELEARGKRCFGAGEGEKFELDKWLFHQEVKKAGLPNQMPVKVIGIDKLRAYLKNKKDVFVKISFYRGTFETWEHKDITETDYYLDVLQAEIGANKDWVEFLVQEPIESEVEVGYDGFNVRGEYPVNSMCGVEIKDKFYLGCVLREQPAIINHVGDKLREFFRSNNYRGFYSNEIRVANEAYSKDFKGKPYYIDPTCRAPSPPSEVFVEMYEPHCLARAVWDIAEGKVPTLTPQYKWGAQIVLQSPWHDKHWLHVKYPSELKRWLKLKNSCVIDGETWCVPNGNGGFFGAITGTGATPKEAFGAAIARFEKIQAQEMECRGEDLFTKAMKQFKCMKEYRMF